MDEKQKKEDEEVRKIATVVVKTLSKLEEKKKEQERREEAEEKLKDLLLISGDDVDLSEFSRAELEKTMEILNALQYRPAHLRFSFLESFREYWLTIALIASLVVTGILLLLRW